jgi:hypothetical protein
MIVSQTQCWRSAVPPHWFRPLGNPHERPPGEKEKVVSRLKSKNSQKKYVIVASDEKPSDDAIFLVDDDLEQD